VHWICSRPQMMVRVGVHSCQGCSQSLDRVGTRPFNCQSCSESLDWVGRRLPNCQSWSESLHWVRTRPLNSVRAVRRHWTGWGRVVSTLSELFAVTRLGRDKSIQLSELIGVSGLGGDTSTQFCQRRSESLDWVARGLPNCQSWSELLDWVGTRPFSSVRAVRNHWTGWGLVHSIRLGLFGVHKLGVDASTQLSGLFAVTGLGGEAPIQWCKSCSHSMNWVGRHLLSGVTARHGGETSTQLGLRSAIE
jgi:hypothetical protein